MFSSLSPAAFATARSLGSRRLASTSATERAFAVSCFIYILSRAGYNLTNTAYYDACYLVYTFSKSITVEQDKRKCLHEELAFRSWNLSHRGGYLRGTLFHVWRVSKMYHDQSRYQDLALVQKDHDALSNARSDISISIEALCVGTPRLLNGETFREMHM
jgi:hypothetical protein